MARTLSPDLVVTALMVSMITSWDSSGRPRQFIDYLGAGNGRPQRRARDVGEGRSTTCAHTICSAKTTECDDRSAVWWLSCSAAGRAGRGGDLDGPGGGSSSGRCGGGVPGVPAGAGDLAEHGEVVCAGAGVVVAVVTCV